MQRLSLLAAVLMIFALPFFSPGPVKSGMRTETCLGIAVPHDDGPRLHFSIFEVNSDKSTADKVHSNNSAPDGGIGYSSEKIPWLGFATEASVLQADGQDLETSIDADTDFDPLTNFVLFCNPSWRLQPLVSIGPTLIISDGGNQKVESLNHIFMGIYYNF